MSPTHYKEFFDNQEEPELLPNEVAGRLAELVGAPHYDVHLMLLDLNPVLGVRGEDLTLSLTDLSAACLHLAALDVVPVSHHYGDLL